MHHAFHCYLLNAAFCDHLTSVFLPYIVEN
ncbi:hypothetical protein M6B38_285185 [Iris pallida]|uniref:Uncharacterized protein n=1 Tax=Iris pallida TaxID=29817 RepID=A0AAX6I1I3_IRIPA|nr:hypothetical protein M6B38_285185 [Iris pallida]